MSTVPFAAEQRVILDNISWQTYLAILNDAENRRGRITYDRGVLEIMAPSKLAEMRMDSTIAKHIAITPGICGGKPRIAGHRIRVQDIVLWHERLGYSPDEIVSKYPQLTMGNVYAALAYYHDNLETIRSDIDEGEAHAQSLQQKTPSKLLHKLIARDGNPGSVSS